MNRLFITCKDSGLYLEGIEIISKYKKNAYDDICEITERIMTKQYNYGTSARAKEEADKQVKIYEQMHPDIYDYFLKIRGIDNHYYIEVPGSKDVIDIIYDEIISAIANEMRLYNLEERKHYIEKLISERMKDCEK